MSGSLTGSQMGSKTLGFVRNYKDNETYLPGEKKVESPKLKYRIPFAPNIRQAAQNSLAHDSSHASSLAMYSRASNYGQVKDKSEMKEDDSDSVSQSSSDNDIDLKDL